MRTGEIQTLTVERISDYGLYLGDGEGGEVLLPNRFTRLDMKPGDEVSVFVYHDSEDRLVASTEKPLIKVGEVAALKVVDKSIHGAFLDWGLSGKHNAKTYFEYRLANLGSHQRTKDITQYGW